MKPLRLEMRLRNNRLIAAREELGLSAPAAADAIGVSLGILYALEGLRESPLRAKVHSDSCVCDRCCNGPVWKETAERIASFYGLSCEYLWPADTLAVKRAAAALTIDARDALGLIAPSDEGPSAELLQALDASVRSLPPREEKILRMRYGKREMTLGEIGAHLGIGRERVRMLEARAFRRLRSKARPVARVWAEENPS